MRVYRDDIKSWFSLPRADKVYVNKTDGGKVHRTSTDDCDKNHVEIEYSKADVMDEQWTDAPETTQEDIDRLPNQDDLAELNKITHPELEGACIHCGINPSELDFTDDYEFQPEGRVWKPKDYIQEANDIGWKHGVKEGKRLALDQAIFFMFRELGEAEDGRAFKRWLKGREDE